MDWRTRSKGCGPTRRNTRKVSNGCWPNWQQNRGSVWYRSSSTPSTQQPPDEDKNLIINIRVHGQGAPFGCVVRNHRLVSLKMPASRLPLLGGECRGEGERVL